MKTVVPKVNDNEKQWYVINGENQVLGRLASNAAYILRGKHKPEFTPHLDLGDHVIILNADKIRVTGRKMSQKQYKRYSGFPGGLRTKSLETLLQSKPERVVTLAVKGMLPKNRLGRKMIKKLRVYTGDAHHHEAQKPVELPNHLRRS